MTQASPPADQAISIDDFHSSGCNEVLQQCKEALQKSSKDRLEYPSRSTALSQAASVAAQENCPRHATVLKLLAMVCSMMLKAESITEPYRLPLQTMSEDFGGESLSLFAQILDFVDDIYLKARLADLLWLLSKPRNYKHALVAIDAYRSMPINVESWTRENSSLWTRSIVLAETLRGGAGDRLAEIHDVLLNAIMTTDSRHGLFGLHVARVLKKVPVAVDNRLKVANRLSDTAQRLGDAGKNILGAREFYHEAAIWFEGAKNHEKCAEMIAAEAETYVTEAKQQTTSPLVSHMMANGLYEQAIQTYRLIPSMYREAHRVDEKIVELRKLLSESGAQLVHEMAVVRTSVDITDLVEEVRESTKGKNAIEAMQILTGIHAGENYDTLRNSVIERMNLSPLHSLFAPTLFSSDGRTIARAPATTQFGAVDPELDEKTIYLAMVDSYKQSLGITVKGIIIPALETLRQEHRLCERDFIDLAQGAPIIPADRATLFGKALHAGYDGDFVIAIHLLVPQIEHMVRTHLKQLGALTTNYSKDGIENENGLSTLMSSPEAERVYGKNLAFELRALFCEPAGPNLRNQLAHGLLNELESRSFPSVYAWWLGLKLVFFNWWDTNASRNNAQETNP